VVALLTIVSAPVLEAALLGSKVTARVNDWPGSSVALELEPLSANPVPLTEIFEIFAFEFPVFLIVVCNVSVVPTVTLPKLSDAGLEVSVTTEACAVAFQEICAGEPVALVEILIAPLAAPAEDGFNEAVRFALCPAAIFKGVVTPETLIPGPVALTLEIVNSDWPELLKRIVCVVVLPVATVPKLTEAGVTERAGDDNEAVAIAVQPIASGEFAALLVTVSVPEAFPAFVGLKTALRLALAPEASVRGREGLDTEMPAPEAETAETVMLDEPVFVREID
jgi:hypothetical protein